MDKICLTTGAPYVNKTISWILDAYIWYLILLLTNIHNNFPWDSVRPFRWLQIEVFFKLTSTSSCRIAILEDCRYLVVIGRIYLEYFRIYIGLDGWSLRFVIITSSAYIVHNQRHQHHPHFNPQSLSMRRNGDGVCFFFFFSLLTFFLHWLIDTTALPRPTSTTSATLEPLPPPTTVRDAPRLESCLATTNVARLRPPLYAPHNISTHSKGKERLREARKGKGLPRETSNDEDRPKRRH